MTSSAVDRCERELRRAILRGELVAGERLPPERVLAERLGVNRTTLRAALARLGNARLLRVRQGSGYVVQDYRRASGLEVLAEVASLSSASALREIVKDVLAVRRRLATMVFERLAHGVRSDAVPAIEDAVERFAHQVAASASVETLAAADLEVTEALLKATDSQVFGLILNPVSLVVRDLHPLRELMYAEPEGNLAAYRMLIGWLARPEAAAVEVMVEQLERRDEELLRRFDARYGGGD